MRDNIRTRRYPWVNKALVGFNLLVFLYELLLGDDLLLVLYQYGLVPARLWGELSGSPSLAVLGPLAIGAPPALATLVSSMFLHAGWIHVGSNMLHLWIFGDNVEDRMGHYRYLVFYLASGVAAGLLQAIFSAGSRSPIIGASGAVAGVLGAYFLLYPWAKVSTLVPLFFFFTVIEIPAGIFLFFWFFTQLWNGALTLTTVTSVGGGVAWFAHIGGFITGILLLRAWRIRREGSYPYDP